MEMHDLTCQQLVELVTDYLEAALPADERILFEAHLAACEGCEVYLEQIRRTIETLGTLSEETLPAPARDELLALFRGWKVTQNRGSSPTTRF